jgi:hypothetical protein
MVFVNAEPPAAHTPRPRATTRTPRSPTPVACGFAVTAIPPAMGGVEPEFPGVAKPMGAARAPGISVGQPTAEQFDRNCSIRNRTKQGCPDMYIARPLSPGRASGCSTPNCGLSPGNGTATDTGRRKQTRRTVMCSWGAPRPMSAVRARTRTSVRCPARHACAAFT